ncbi:G-box-binding factor isoform X2 [Calliphora vicina]|uniref:G-box-binding factor isoform X2 n=1 Tax=Calliphora vicina TaxID=7373 RepID=UPI00325B4CCA
MSCISSNFSSFFLNSLNDPSEFSKYLSNGELRFSSTFEDFQVYGQNNAQQQQQQHYQQQQHHINGGVGVLCNANGEIITSNGDEGNSNIENTQPIVTSVQHYGSYQAQQMQQHHLQQQQTRWALPHQQTNHQQNLPLNAAAASAASTSGVATAGNQHFDGSFEFMKYLRHSNDYNDNAHDAGGQPNQSQSSHAIAVGTKPEASLNNGLMDLDNAHKRAAARKTPVLSSVNSNHHNSATSNSSHPTPMDIYDHDSKHNIYDLHHMNSMHSSNSNESSMELSSMNYPNSHLNASNSNTSSEGGNTQNHSDFSMLSGVGKSQNSTTANAATTAAAAAAAAATASPAAPKPLATFTIKDNFEAHPSHKVEEGIFQHMNKLPPKKKDNLKQLGVRFTGQMTLNDKSIIVENFIKFCQEYEIKDHRPFLSLNQSGLNKPDQIKFARYLGQGLPTFTLFCIYSNFKNLFCTKRTEIYTKDGYNLPYILDKIKRFLANTTADLKNIINNQSNDSMDFLTTVPTVAAPSTNSMMNPMSSSLNSLPPPLIPQQPQSSLLSPMGDFGQTKSQLANTRPLESLMIYENFDVHETHRIEDGISTQMARLPPKKQELLKQFGIQTNQTVTYYEKYIIIENFNRFCNEYKVADHRPFLDLQENGLPKSEQLKFIRYLGQGLPNLTLSKIYLVFKDLLGISRIEKMALDGYNLDAILKKKKKNLYNRMTAAAVHKECHPEASTQTKPSTSISTTPAQPSTPLMPLYQQDAYKT